MKGKKGRPEKSRYFYTDAKGFGRWCFHNPRWIGTLLLDYAAVYLAIAFFLFFPPLALTALFICLLPCHPSSRCYCKHNIHSAKGKNETRFIVCNGRLKISRMKGLCRQGCAHTP